MSSEKLSHRRIVTYLDNPSYLLIITIIIIFMTEAAIMLLISLLPQLPAHQYAMIDAILLIIIVFPLLHFFLLKPYVKARESAEEDLKKSERRYRSLVESTKNSIYIVDRNYNYLFMNREHISRLGLSNDQHKGQSFSKFHSPEETELFAQKVDKVFQTGESAEYEYKSFRDGRYFLQTYTPVKEENGTTVSVTITSKDINKLKQMEMELRALSITDDLTGLYNRRGFLAMAEQQLKVANRQKIRMFLIFADIDGLKKINDTCGHSQGSQAIMGAADILRQTFREADVIARLGGDEFVILGMEKPEVSVGSLSKRLQVNLATYNVNGKNPVKLELSFGIVRFDPEQTCSIERLLSQADTLMYEQKREKKR